MTADKLLRLADTIDRLGAAAKGIAAACVGLLMVAQVAVIVLRAGFGLGALWLEELPLYFHAAIFLLAAAATLRAGGHVRVDIFLADAAPRRRALVDLIGGIVFLLPFTVALAIVALPYVARAWAIHEGSPAVGGLPLVFLLKTLILVFAGLLLLQGLAQIIRAGCTLARLEPRPSS